MDSPKSNENTELKTFILTLRSGNLIKLIESNQSHIQEKYNLMCSKVKQHEEEITRQLLILQQNSHLIEKFQDQLQELSYQNSELLEKQQVFNEENDNLRNQLQCSENKFAQLDIFYDQQVSALSERINELEPQITELENMQNKSNELIDQNQTELHEKLRKTEQLNADLEMQLKHFANQREDEKKGLESEIDKLNMLKETLTHKICKYEENIEGLQNNLAEVLAENKEVIELKNKIEKLNSNRYEEQNEYHNEKSQLITANENLKVLVDDLQKKLSSKEKETEEIYIKFKQLTRFAVSIPEHPPSIQSSKCSTRRRPSTDDPQPIYNSSDSDGSSISFYKLRKKQRFSTETEDENLFGFKNSSITKTKRGPSVLKNQPRISAVPPVITRKRPYPQYEQHIEIPESPVVSSSALPNPDLKL